MRPLLQHCLKATSGEIVVRRLGMSDAGDLFAMCKDEEVSKYMTWLPHKNLFETKDYLHSVLDEYDDKRPAARRTWAIAEKETNKVVGTCGYLDVDQLDTRRAEIGYCLAASAWGKGYASSAVAVLEGWAKECGLARLQATCVPGNVASKKLLLRRGWKNEGLLRSFALDKMNSDKLIDVEMWSVLL